MTFQKVLLPFSFAGILAVTLPAPGQTPPPVKPAAAAEVKDLRALLFGSWRFKLKDGGVSANGVTTYKDDGTWKSKGTFDLGEVKMELEAEGKWKIDGKKLSFEVTKSNQPDLMEVGMKWTETILSITDTEFRYKDDEDGGEMVETRVKPEKKP